MRRGFPIANRRSRTSDGYDVAVVGGTPAGLAAAITLARAKHRVAVVASPCSPAESPLADWVPRDLVDLAPFLKSAARAGGAEGVSAVWFHSTDGSKSARYGGRKDVAYTLGAGKLAAAMAAVARKGGVSFVGADAAATVRLGENGVTVVGRREVRAKILLIACGQPSDVIADLALPVRNAPVGRLTAAGLDVTWSAAKVHQQFGKSMHVACMSDGGGLALFFGVGAKVHLRLVYPPDSALDPAEALSDLLTRLRKARLLPKEISPTRMRASAWRPPAGVALEVDSQVAKRTLLIGTAGGFADQITAQTIVPSVRSALVAAEVAAKALASKDPQGVLNTFKTKWRKALARYLSPPNAAVHLLMPLLFANKRMVTRFARAMLYGESI